jgi:hypothetical protein
MVDVFPHLHLTLHIPLEDFVVTVHLPNFLSFTASHFDDLLGMEKVDSAR